jgi:hypothetical protein
MDHKVNMYKEINFKSNKVVRCRASGSGKRTKRRLSDFNYTFIFKEEEELDEN